MDETVREVAHNDVAEGQVPAVLTVTGDLLPNDLTEEQARAIATDEDVTLVLAGAGTGKTAVIIGNIVHLVRNQGMEPEKVLALACNRKAAIEIRERLPQDLKGAHVSTFLPSPCGSFRRRRWRPPSRRWPRMISPTSGSSRA